MAESLESPEHWQEARSKSTRAAQWRASGVLIARLSLTRLPPGRGRARNPSMPLGILCVSADEPQAAKVVTCPFSPLGPAQTAAPAESFLIDVVDGLVAVGGRLSRGGLWGGAGAGVRRRGALTERAGLARRERRSEIVKKLTVFRWDLDKTYLVSDFESLRGLLRIPFERAQDKRAVPGVIALVKALRRTAERRERRVSVCFVSASPPQIGQAIRDKLLIDRIEYDEIRFKDQMRHLVRGRFDLLREQIGYKLSELLRSARVTEAGADELLFGDDWESDPLVYSLYADVVAGRIDRARVGALLEQAGVHADYLDSIFDSMTRGLRPRRVRSICILRARPRADHELAAFGKRLLWFDNYFEGALSLHALGDLDPEGVVSVARGCELDPVALTRSFEATVRRGCGLRREHLTLARVALRKAGLISPVAAGRVLGRASVRIRTAFGLPPLSQADSGPPPAYEALLASWTRRGRKEAGAESGEAQERGESWAKESASAADGSRPADGRGGRGGDDDAHGER